MNNHTIALNETFSLMWLSICLSFKKSKLRSSPRFTFITADYLKQGIVFTVKIYSVSGIINCVGIVNSRQMETPADEHSCRDYLY